MPLIKFTKNRCEKLENMILLLNTNGFNLQKEKFMSDIEIDILWEIEEEEHIKDLLHKAVEVALASEEAICPVALSMVITDNERIRILNAKHRDKDVATDVLSFPGYEKEEWNEIKKSENIAFIGDIVISKEKVEEQAELYENTFEREFAYLTVHGMLHLMGYDHIEENDKTVMRRKEEEILKILDLTRE
jgi:probable rRNA maturation factor